MGSRRWEVTYVQLNRTLTACESLSVRSAAVRRVYETNGATMYEVAVPMHGDGWTSGHYISDWAEDVLRLSDNEHLKSSTFEVLGSNIFS